MTFISELRSTLLTLLSDPSNLIGGNILGTYTDLKQKTIPAIWVGNTPETFIVSGLECVISLVPEISSLTAANPSNANVHLIEIHTVYLVQHSSPNNLNEAMVRIARWCPEAEISRQQSYDDNLDILEQVVVNIKRYVRHKAIGRISHRA